MILFHRVGVVVYAYVWRRAVLSGTDSMGLTSIGVSKSSYIEKRSGELTWKSKRSSPGGIILTTLRGAEHRRKNSVCRRSSARVLRDRDDGRWCPPFRQSPVRMERFSASRAAA